MATLLKTDGTKEAIMPMSEVFSLREISLILNGIIEPIFIGEYWLFYCKNGKGLNLPLNQPATNMIGMEVYGSIIIASDSELSPTFLIPPEIVHEIKAVGQRIMDKQQPVAEEDIPEELKEQALDSIMESGYKFLISEGREFDSIMTNFELYNDGIDKIVIGPDKVKRIGAIDKLINHFSEKEDYEKCANLTKFKNKVVNYYNNYLND